MPIAKPSKEELAEILKAHIRWLSKEVGGVRADLSDADLRCAGLTHADLRGAGLSDADLRCADLRGADLRCAGLTRADLRGAGLSDADLRCADLRGADLRGADLTRADLRGADLRGADLTDADLRGADLTHADLRGADLTDADLRGAQGADLALARTEIVPREGSFVGWKKCRKGKIVKLRIPEDARRSNATGRKCRCSKAEVLEIVRCDGTACPEATSYHDSEVTYRVGEVVEVGDFNDDRLHECAEGIHFYLTPEEARNH